ncbi:MAG: hypothetical protein Fur0041_15900 [Bacteroidia bacterium]
MKYLNRPVRLLIAACISITGIFAGCSVLDPAEEVPSYIKIDAINLNIVNPNVQGSGSHKITDAWIYIDGTLIGAFELPCKFPVLAEGAHSLIVRAGIKMNGTSTTRAMYPFYRGYEETVSLTRGQVTQVNPTVEYFSGTNFLWLENFENQGISIDDITGANFPGILDTIGAPEAFEGHSGVVHLNADTFNFICRSSVPYSFAGGSDVYLELNYRCNNPFTIGIYSNTTQFIPWVTINASYGWNKIYVRLTDAMASNPNINYNVYFAMQKLDDVLEPYLYIDNIKLLK